MKVLKKSSLKIREIVGKRYSVSTDFILIPETPDDELFCAFINGPFSRVHTDHTDRNPNRKLKGRNGKKLVVEAYSGSYNETCSTIEKIVSHLNQCLPWNEFE